MKVNISNEQIQEYLERTALDLPMYVSSFLNYVNQVSQRTRPKVVGQMSELFNQFGSGPLAEWEKWYYERNPDTITRATDKIWQMVSTVRSNVDKIDRTMVEKWVKDLVIVKTYIGLGCHEVILKKGAELMGMDYRFSNSEEEVKGIDGYLGEIAVSIKPHSYKIKAALPEQIEAKVIYYKKSRDGIEIDFGEIL